MLRSLRSVRHSFSTHFAPRSFAWTMGMAMAVGAVAACSDGAVSTPAAADVHPTHHAAFRVDTAGGNKTPAVRATQFANELKAAGVDPNNLGTWEETKAAFGRTVKAEDLMGVISKSLGVECKSCHSGALYAVPQETQRVVARMWNDWVRGLRQNDGTPKGAPMFCDSCHQGQKSVLDRSDSLGEWMDENFVAGVVRTDGANQTCGSCHGKPFNPSFLEQWKKGT